MNAVARILDLIKSLVAKLVDALAGPELSESDELKALREDTILQPRDF
jgi:hypothetical protein